MKHKMIVIGVTVLIALIVIPRSRIYRDFREETQRKERVQKYFPEIQELVTQIDDVLNGRILIENEENPLWMYAFKQKDYPDAVRQNGTISIWDITMDKEREKATVDISWSRVRYDNRGNATSWGGDWDRITIERRDDEWIIISTRARIPTNAELK